MVDGSFAISPSLTTAVVVLIFCILMLVCGSFDGGA